MSEVDALRVLEASGLVASPQAMSDRLFFAGLRGSDALPAAADLRYACGLDLHGGWHAMSYTCLGFRLAMTVRPPSDNLRVMCGDEIVASIRDGRVMCRPHALPEVMAGLVALEHAMTTPVRNAALTSVMRRIATRLVDATI